MAQTLQLRLRAQSPRGAGGFEDEEVEVKSSICISTSLSFTEPAVWAPIPVMEITERID